MKICQTLHRPAEFLKGSFNGIKVLNYIVEFGYNRLISYLEMYLKTIMLSPRFLLNLFQPTVHD